MLPTERESNVILFTSLLKSLGVFMTLQIKTSFESANVSITVYLSYQQ